MPSVLEFYWLSPSLPLITASCIGLIFVLFRKTVARLSKPVGFLFFLTFLVSSIIVFSLFFDDKVSSAINYTFFDWKTSLIDVQVGIGLCIDSISYGLYPITSIILILLLITSHYYMNKKREYVPFLICIGFFGAFLLYLLGSTSTIESLICWLLLGFVSIQLRKQWYLNRETTSSLKINFVLDRISEFLFVSIVFLLFFISHSFRFDDLTIFLTDTLSRTNTPTNLLYILIASLLILTGLKFLQVCIVVIDMLNSKLLIDKSAFLYSIGYFLPVVFLALKLKPIFYQII